MDYFLLRRTLTIAGLSLLTGCATFSANRGLDDVRQMVADRGGTAPPVDGPRDCADPAAGVVTLTAEPLAPDSAIQIALTCNTSLAAEYASLGIARAETFQAARLANPTLSAAALDSSARGAPPQIELGLMQNFTNLLLRGPRMRLAEGEFLRTQQRLAGDILQLGAQTRADYYTLVGTQQVASVRHAVSDAQQTSAELAQRFHRAGNLSARVLAEYQAAAAQALVDARKADNDAITARVALMLDLGLPASMKWSVPDRLSVPLDEDLGEEALEQRADQNRLDLAAARKLVVLLAASEQAARKFRWLGEFNVGLSYERDPDRSRLLGPALSIQLPIFDQGQGPVARAQALKNWSDAEQRRLTQIVAGTVQLAYRRMLNARDRAHGYRHQIIPQRQNVVARTQEEQNYMLVGAFDLLAAKRAEFDAYQGYLDAVRDYWVARANLELAIGASLPGTAQPAAEGISAQQLLTPLPAKNGTQHHGGMQDKKTPAKPEQPNKDHSAHDHDAAEHEHHGDTP